MDLNIGLDLGSTAIKMVITENGQMKWYKKVPTAPGQEGLATQMVVQTLQENGIDPDTVTSIAATGYGKGLVTSAGKVVDEITANAKGMFILSKGKCRTIINIGGQDLKVINLLENGQIGNFKMNDKCAAGTGRFFELVARLLDTPISEFGKLSASTDEIAELNSTCVVFAESEVVSLLAKGTPKECIIKGLHYSVARRVGNMLGRAGTDGGLYLDGGPAQNQGLIAALEDELMLDVHVLPQPQFTVAFGAAVNE